MTNNKKKTNFVKSKTNPIGQIMATRKKEALKTSSHRGEVYRGVTTNILTRKPNLKGITL